MIAPAPPVRNKRRPSPPPTGAPRGSCRTRASSGRCPPAGRQGRGRRHAHPGRARRADGARARSHTPRAAGERLPVPPFRRRSARAVHAPAHRQHGQVDLARVAESVPALRCAKAAAATRRWPERALALPRTAVGRASSRWLTRPYPEGTSGALHQQPRAPAVRRGPDRHCRCQAPVVTMPVAPPRASPGPARRWHAGVASRRTVAVASCRLAAECIRPEGPDGRVGTLTVPADTRHTTGAGRLRASALGGAKREASSIRRGEPPNGRESRSRAAPRRAAAPRPRPARARRT